MTGIRRVSQLGTTGESTYVDGSIFDVDIHASANIAQSKIANLASDLAAKAPKADPTFTGTVSGITKTMVGLGSVDNTAETATPVSTAQQTALNLKANLASPTFTGTLGASAITASGTVRGSGSIVQVVSNSQGASDLTSAGYIGTVTMTPKFADSTILVWVNYHAYKYNSTTAVNNYYQLRNITASTVIRENPYLTYGPPDYMFQGVISGVQAAGSTSSRQYGLLVDSSAAQRVYFYWSTTYAMEIAA